MSFGEDIDLLVAENAKGVLSAAPGWERVPLGQVAKIINGFAFDSKHFGPNGDHGLVRIRDVIYGNTNTFYSGAVPDGYWVESGDLLVGMDGDFNCAKWKSKRALLNQRVCKIVPDERKLLHQFLEYMLPGYLRLINDYTSSVTVKHLSSRTLQCLPIPLPTVEEQLSLVGRINELFAEIDDGEAALIEARSSVETYRKALLKAAVTGELTADWRHENPSTETGQNLLTRILGDRRKCWQLDPKNQRKRYKEPVPVEAEELIDLPDGWTWATLQQLAFISGGATVDQKRRPADPVEVPYLRVANVQRGALKLDVVKTITIEADALPALRLEFGDLLLNEGGDRDKVGRGWVWRDELPVCVHQNHVFKARPVSADVSSELVSRYLNEMGRKFFLDESKQTTNLASISLTKISMAPVPVPPPLEAKVILERLQAAERSLNGDVIENAVGFTTDLRQSILSKAFRGQLL